MMQSAEVLVHYDPGKDIVLSCDASPYRVGAVLSHHMEDGTERPIGFTSRTLNAAKKNFSQMEKEGTLTKKVFRVLFSYTVNQQTTTGL